MKRKEWIKQYQSLKQELLLSQEKRNNILTSNAVSTIVSATIFGMNEAFEGNDLISCCSIFNMILLLSNDIWIWTENQKWNEDCKVFMKKKKK